MHTRGCCCRTKAHIVSQDEREKGLRTILIFDIPLAQAPNKLQAVYPAAIALGMLYESSIAYQMGLVDRL